MKNLLISIFVIGVLLCSNAHANQIQKLLAGDAQVGDDFGRSVSISGDYAIVANGEDDGGSGTGRRTYLIRIMAAQTIGARVSVSYGRGSWWDSGASQMNVVMRKKYFDRLCLVSMLKVVLEFRKH